MKKSRISLLVVIVSAVFSAIYAYPLMPDQMATHWNFFGQPDGYMSRWIALILMPVLSLGLYLLTTKFVKSYLAKKAEQPLDPEVIKNLDSLMVMLLGILLYVHILTIVWNAGFHIPIAAWLVPAISLLFYYLGTIMENSKPNPFIGIRTPWALKNEAVWQKTHYLAGILFKTLAIFMLTGITMGGYAAFMIVIPIITATLFLVIYSYYEHMRI